MPGSTQKCPPQHAPVNIAIIKHYQPPPREQGEWLRQNPRYARVLTASFAPLPRSPNLKVFPQVNSFKWQNNNPKGNMEWTHAIIILVILL